jgi:hypothetical protein
MEEVAFKYGVYIRISTESFSANIFTVLLSCVSLIISFNVSQFYMKNLIRTELQNSRTVHLLVLKKFVNIFERHGMSNITVDTNIFDN